MFLLISDLGNVASGGVWKAWAIIRAATSSGGSTGGGRNPGQILGYSQAWRQIGLVTIAADAESSTDPRVKSAFFIVEQDGEQLAALGKLFDSGELKAFVKAELPMEEADHAYNGSIPGNPGKVIIWWE